MSSSGATIGKIKIGQNGSASRIWAIAGVDTHNSNALALLSTTPIHIMMTTVNDNDLIEYSSSGYGSMDFVVNTEDKYLNALYFSEGENGVMNPVQENI